MKRILLPMAFALLGAVDLSAQTSPAVVPDSMRVSGECLLGMQAQDWSALGLTTAQVTQVQAIQTDCKTACQATAETGEKDSAAARGALAKHQERITKLLTKEQFDKWVSWCAEHGGHTQLLER